MSLFLWGQAAVGYLAGLLIGFSKSAVVGAVVPAVLAFSSSSALSLSVADSTTADDQHFIGVQLILLTASISLGLGVGLLAAKFIGQLPLKP